MIPPELDITRPHPARIYDYMLGGKDNFAADREAAELALKADPKMSLSVRANRAFLARTVRFLAGEAGIRQFLDIGTGLPAAGNTHEVAQSVDPTCRIVYADNDRCKSGCGHRSHRPVKLDQFGETDHGRGVNIIEALSASWGWRPQP
jgi:hypothetical protein